MARSDDMKQERLRQLALFKGADNTAIKHLASAADEIEVEAGHTLIQQGHHHQELFIIEEGGATVTVDDEQVAEIPAGEMVGELSYFVRAGASATVVTSSASIVLVIPYNRFAQILDDNPPLVRAIALELAERLHAMDQRLHEEQSK